MLKYNDLNYANELLLKGFLEPPNKINKDLALLVKYYKYIYRDKIKLILLNNDVTMERIKNIEMISLRDIKLLKLDMQTENNIMLEISKIMKEIKQLLFDFILKHDKTYHESFREDYDKDIDKIIYDMFNNRYKFNICVRAEITLEEMKYINNLNTKCEKQVFFALLFISRFYQTNVIHVLNKDIMELANVSINYVNEMIDSLVEKKFIKRVNQSQKAYLFKNKKLKNKKSRTYRILIPKGKTIIYTITDHKTVLQDFNKIYEMCINKYGFEVRDRFKDYICAMN